MTQQLDEKDVKEIKELLTHIRGSLPSPKLGYVAPRQGWTCFHCGETFMSEDIAQIHFGVTPDQRPMCVIGDTIQEGDYQFLLRFYDTKFKYLCNRYPKDQIMKMLSDLSVIFDEKEVYLISDVGITKYLRLQVRELQRTNSKMLSKLIGLGRAVRKVKKK